MIGMGGMKKTKDWSAANSTTAIKVFKSMLPISRSEIIWHSMLLGTAAKFILALVFSYEVWIFLVPLTHLVAYMALVCHTILAAQFGQTVFVFGSIYTHIFSDLDFMFDTPLPTLYISFFPFSFSVYFLLLFYFLQMILSVSSIVFGLFLSFVKIIEMTTIFATRIKSIIFLIIIHKKLSSGRELSTTFGATLEECGIMGLHVECPFDVSSPRPLERRWDICLGSPIIAQMGRGVTC